MFKDHMIMYTSRDQDVIQDGETYTTADGKVLTMKKIRGGTVPIMSFFLSIFILVR